MTGDEGLLLDTHIWIWHAEGSDRLPVGLREAIDSRRCFLSPVSVWELGLLHERGRIELDRSVRDWVRTALERHPLSATPVTHEVALVSHEIELEHRDPADRLLAATALVYDLALATVDARLTSRDWLLTLSG